MTQKFITLISRSYRCYVDNANKTSNQPSNYKGKFYKDKLYQFYQKREVDSEQDGEDSEQDGSNVEQYGGGDYEHYEHYSCDGEQDLDGTNIKQDGSSDNSVGSRDQDGIDDGKGGSRDQDGVDDGESGTAEWQSMSASAAGRRTKLIARRARRACS